MYSVSREEEWYVWALMMAEEYIEVIDPEIEVELKCIVLELDDIEYEAFMLEFSHPMHPSLEWFVFIEETVEYVRYTLACIVGSLSMQLRTVPHH